MKQEITKEKTCVNFGSSKRVFFYKMISKVEVETDMSYIESEEKLPKEVYVIAQEIKIIKSLSGNNLAHRAKQLRKLRKWLTLRSNSSYSK